MNIKTTWPKIPYRWQVDDTLFISVPFTWNLPALRTELATGNLLASRVVVGGPAVHLMPDYLAGVAEVGGSVPGVLQRVNPMATRTSYGCPNRCAFCGVNQIAPEFRELDDWPRLPIICDDNLLACSRRHFDKVIDSLKGIRAVDFNQGLDAKLLTPYHASRFAELDSMIRVSWDNISGESAVMQALDYLLAAKILSSRTRCYVLVGFNDTPQDALYRCERLTARGIRPNVQRYEPLDALQKGEYVAEKWTTESLRAFCRFWNLQAWYGGIRFAEYDRKRFEHADRGQPALF